MDPVLLLVLAVALALAIAGGIWLVRWRRHRAELAQQREAERELDQTLEAGRRAVRAVVDTAVRVRDHGFRGAFRDSIDQLAGWAETERPDLQRLAGRDGTLAILFSDIENSTAINEELGDRAWLRILGAHDKVLRSRIERHDGHVIKTQGDGFMVAFANPEEALRSAIEIQQDLSSGNRRLRKAEIKVRIGVHVGQAVARDGDLYGRNVAFAARVAGEAEGGEILASAEVCEAIGDGDGIEFGRAREVALKGIPGEHRLMAVAWE